MLSKRNKWMKIFYTACLAALLCAAHAVRGSDTYSLGYDADHIYYFFRTYAPDKSIQLGFAAGCSWYAAAPMHPAYFRSRQNLDPAASHLYTGLSVEKNFLNMHVALATGVYFSQLNTYLFGWPIRNSGTYIIYPEDDNAVYYNYISSLKTASKYCSIPVELSCALFNRPRLGVYLKGSAMASINVKTEVSMAIDKNSTPEETQAWLLSYFKGREFFFVNAFAGVGMRWGEYSSPNFRMELGLPFMIANNEITYLDIGSGLAARISLYVPLFFFFR